MKPVADHVELRLRHLLRNRPQKWVEERVRDLKFHLYLRACEEPEDVSGDGRLPVFAGRQSVTGNIEVRPLFVALGARWMRIVPGSPTDGLRLEVVAPHPDWTSHWIDGEPEDLEAVLELERLSKPIRIELESMRRTWDIAASPVRGLAAEPP